MNFDEQAESDWTPDDAIATKTFFLGVTGCKLRARYRNMIFRSFVQACSPSVSLPNKDHETESGDYKRGRAQGVYQSANFFDDHFPPAPAVDGANSEDSGESEAA